MKNEQSRRDIESGELPAQETGAADAPAWELVDAGRYRPRRIRGSCRGRELG